MIAIKGFDGILETLGGILFLVISPQKMNRLVILLTTHELSEDPQDWIAQHVLHAAKSLSSSTKLFGSVYLIGHGILKLLLAGALLRAKIWVYPPAIVFLGVFILYQMFRASHTHSVGLLLLTVFDSVVMYLVWREYQSRHKVDALPGKTETL